MAESFLETQLRRIRALTERISQTRVFTEEALAGHMVRETGNPLLDARDYRMISSMRDDSSRETTREHTSSEPARRRPRRRR